MSKTAQPLNAEWSLRLDIDNLPDGSSGGSAEAGEAERRDLARRLNVKAIESLSVDYKLHKTTNSNRVHVSGTVRAEVIQPCVVTLADTKQDISEQFEAWYADKDAAISLTRARHEKLSRHMDSEVPMLEESEDPESLVDGKLDIGELASQYLSLAINPYPRAPGAESAEKILEEEGVSPSVRNPFAALKAWKDGRKRPSRH